MSEGPVVVAIAGDNDAVRFYKAGTIIEDNCSVPDESKITGNDHAVMLVGFGTEDNGVDYWLVQNSWGELYGTKGYMKIKREKGLVGPGVCGIQRYYGKPVLSEEDNTKSIELLENQE